MTAFERFFSEEFPRLLDGVRDVPEALSGDFPLSAASWDRKAAWLLFDRGVRAPAMTETLDLDDLL